MNTFVNIMNLSLAIIHMLEVPKLAVKISKEKSEKN